MATPSSVTPEGDRKAAQIGGAALEVEQEDDQKHRATLEDYLEGGDIGGTTLEVDQMAGRMGGTAWEGNQMAGQIGRLLKVWEEVGWDG